MTVYEESNLHRDGLTNAAKKPRPSITFGIPLYTPLHMLCAFIKKKTELSVDSVITVYVITVWVWVLICVF